MNPEQDDSEITQAWSALESLPEIPVSTDFEKRLMERVEALDHPPLHRWLRLMDGFIEGLHLPALAVLIALLFWIPTSTTTTQQVLKLPERPERGIRGPFKEHPPPIKTRDILEFMIKISRS